MGGVRARRVNMSLWEYKIITSGKGGFASPALLEKFLNDLGREEWEIVQFHTQPDNFLVFTGLARRPTQRDWTLEDAAAAAAKAEADKLRAEFEAKFKAATSGTPGAEEAPASFLEEKVAPDDGFRKPIDTSHDADADEEETKEEDDWDKLTAAQEDELPTFFDAIKPHMRRNQRGPGMSVGVDYLAKKWDQSEDDLKGALVECGFSIPADEDAKPEYLEFEGDLYWININRRGELWINTKEKPRQVFRAVKAQKIAVEDETKPEAQKPEERGHKGEDRGRKHHGHRAEAASTPAAAPVAEATPAATDGQPAESGLQKSEAPGAPLPNGAELLEKIRPLMRRNRRGPGGSGSASFLSRALKCREADLIEAFKSLGLVLPTSPNDKPTNVEIGNGVWWLNADSRGNLWINGRDKKPGETIEAPAPAQSEAPSSETTGAPAGESSPAGSETIRFSVASEAPFAATKETSTPEGVPTASVEARAPSAMGSPMQESTAASGSAADGATTLSAVRPLLRENKTGAFAGKLDRVGESAGKSADELVAQLVAAGLVVPEKPREKPVYVEHGGEIFWLNRNAKGELWLNAKASKSTDKKADEEPTETETPAEAESDGEKKSRRPRSRKKTE